MNRLRASDAQQRWYRINHETRIATASRRRKVNKLKDLFMLRRCLGGVLAYIFFVARTPILYHPPTPTKQWAFPVIVITYRPISQSKVPPKRDRGRGKKKTPRCAWNPRCPIISTHVSIATAIIAAESPDTAVCSARRESWWSPNLHRPSGTGG